MRPMESGQLSLSRLAGLRPVELYVLKTYSDRDAGTVHRTYYFGDRFVEYEYGGGSAQQFLPFVRSHRGPDLQLMSHIQDTGAQLTRSLKLTLVNLQLESGVFLATDFRTTNLRRATIEMSQILLPATGDDRDLAVPFAGTEHTVLFRGEVTAVESITPETIELAFTSVEPRVPWRYALLPGTDPLDFGARFPLPYGKAKRVQLVGHDVGGYTTVAQATTTVITTIQVTDTERLGTSGIGYIGGERITWTGKTATTLTGVTRGSSGTIALEHAPGATLLEIKDSTFIVAGYGVKSIGDVYVRQYNGELVRVVGTVTKNLADTAVTGHTGATLSTVRLPVAQFESIVQQLDTAISFATQPQVSGGTATGMNVLTFDGDNVTSGGEIPASSSILNATVIGFGWKAPRDFPYGAVRAPSGSGSTGATQVKFPAPPAGVTGISQDFIFRSWGTQETFDLKVGGVLIGTATATGSGTPSTPETFSVHASSASNVLGAITLDLERVSGAAFGGALEIERSMLVVQTVPLDSMSVQIGGTDATKGKIGATASRGTGYRLQLYADVEGPVAPDSTYTVPSGTLLESMPDCMHHFASVFCVQGNGAIESTSFAASAADVAPNVHAFDARDFGESYHRILAGMAWESRLNVTEVERATVAQLALTSANRAYRWPGPIEVIDGFVSLEEKGRQPAEIVTRVRALHLRDQSRGGALDREAYAGAISIDKNGTPTSKPTTANLDAAEDRWGRNDSRTLLFASIRDPATLIDVSGYFAWEWIRDSRLWIVRGIPWTVSYRLEPGDVVELRNIPWAPGEEWHARVLGVEWNPDTGQRDLSLIELSPSTSVVEMVARATVTAAAVVAAANLASVAMSARATLTASATQAIVLASVAMSARATVTAALRGGTELASVAMVGKATLLLVLQDGDSGQILGLVPESQPGESQSFGHRGAIDFQTVESMTSAAATIGTANAWTMAVWFATDSLAIAETVVEITSDAGTINRLALSVRGTVANDPIRVELNDSSGTLFKSYTWDSLMSIDTWTHIAFSWNGTSLVFYRNGELRTATATGTDTAGTMTDTSREVTVGSTEAAAEFFDGQVHSVALWSSVLTQNAIRKVYNQGDAANMNLLVDDDDYADAVNLKHWWKLGHKINALGADSGVGTAITLS